MGLADLIARKHGNKPNFNRKDRPVRRTKEKSSQEKAEERNTKNRGISFEDLAKGFRPEKKGK